MTPKKSAPKTITNGANRRDASAPEAPPASAKSPTSASARLRASAKSEKSLAVPVASAGIAEGARATTSSVAAYAPPAAAVPAVDPGTRRQWIAQAAYLKAQRRGLRDGSPVQDWLEAEVEIDGMIREGRLPGAPSGAPGAA